MNTIMEPVISPKSFKKNYLTRLYVCGLIGLNVVLLIPNGPTHLLVQLQSSGPLEVKILIGQKPIIGHSNQIKTPKEGSIWASIPSAVYLLE